LPDEQHKQKECVLQVIDADVLQKTVFFLYQQLRIVSDSQMRLLLVSVAQRVFEYLGDDPPDFATSSVQFVCKLTLFLYDTILFETEVWN